ncbi:MAG: hypothetical protein KBT11_04235 [Treponema sp.]|nr:hypothetical protein [Candidatus Treponema equifaecale]
MKKSLKLLFCAAAIFTSFQAFAFNFGGFINNSTKLRNTVMSDGSLKADQLNQGTLWIRQPFSNAGTSFLAVQGTYQFEKDFDLEDDPVQTLNLDTFKLEFNKELEAGNLIFAAGRFGSADLTGLILNQALDGLQLTLIKPWGKFQIGGGYTGLLNKHFASMLDQNQAEYAKDTEKFYDLAEKYAVAKMGISFQNLFVNQTLSIEGFGAIHLQDEDFNRIYGTLALNGPLSEKVFYELSSTVEAASFDGGDYEIANLSKGSIAFYPPVNDMSVYLNAVYASEKFLGFTSCTAVNANGLPAECSDLFKAGLSAGVKPVSFVLLSGSGDAVFEAKEFEYMGFQYGLNMDVQPVSDFYIGLALSQFFHKEESDFNKTTLEIKARLVF